jgi:hypothetical protein
MDDEFEMYGPYDPISNPPSLFLVFAVAKLNGQYRQLAVAQYETGQPAFSQWTDTLRACRGVITALSDPANRTAIEGELALAGAAYTHGGLAPPRSEVQRGSPFRLSGWERERVNRWWNRDMVALPFISTCLVVSVAGECNHRGSQVTAGPLGLVYNDENPQYSMVVVDISDLDRVRYGIVAFGTTTPFMELGRFAMDNIPEHTRPRRPLSVKAYIRKFAPFYDCGRDEVLAAAAAEMDKLQMEKYELVDLDALEGRTRHPSHGELTCH